MDLIKQLECLRFSDEALEKADDAVDYWELKGANDMLNNCLNIVYKWLDQEGYIQ